MTDEYALETKGIETVEDKMLILVEIDELINFGIDGIVMTGEPIH